MELDLGGAKLPFLFDMRQAENGDLSMLIKNASEDILVHDIELNGDTIVVRMPLFDSEFRGVLHSREFFTGYWTNFLKGPDYRIPFVAQAGDGPRFLATTGPSADISGVWETHFAYDTDRAYPALGIFEQDALGRVTGTFMTETGDYRYLEGSITGDTLRMSSFDGAFAFLFSAALTNGVLEGRFWSGNHWQCGWRAKRNPDFKLTDPDSLTKLREGYHMADFSFPDLQGRPISPKDDRFQGKVLVIQIMGSWCPNCVDETRLLNELYAAHHEEGLEVLSVAFEKHADTVRAIHGLQRFRDVLGVEYPILYAGMAGKGMAAEKLPFLEHVMSFPTCIIVDHAGTVRRIRTGIYGPSTGEHYKHYKRSLESFVAKLLLEARQSALAQN
jgi:thiol-disulfide isomerase/thioredoxin